MESKVSVSFPSAQLLIEGFVQPFRRDRIVNGRGILLYVRNDIPSKQLINHTLPGDIKCLIVELNVLLNS